MAAGERKQPIFWTPILRENPNPRFWAPCLTNLQAKRNGQTESTQPPARQKLSPDSAAAADLASLKAPKWARILFGIFPHFVLGLFPGYSVLELAGAISPGPAVVLTRFAPALSTSLALFQLGNILFQHPQHHELALLSWVWGGFKVGLGLVQGGFQACVGQVGGWLGFRYWDGLVLVYGGLLGVGLELV